jgi:RNA polymerase sigma-70 factor (ECF subfamily)
LDLDFDTTFRREAGRLTAGLTRAFGPGRLTLAEDVVQETFLRAMHDWPTRGVPPSPSAWLARVARNLAIDRLRREGLYSDEAALEFVAIDPGEPAMMDDELAMLLMCGHPALAPESQIALTLKAVCGLGVGEIAKGLLSTETAVSQRLVRAKNTLREQNVAFEIPIHPEERLAVVLRVLYLLFNEGYLAAAGAALTDSEVCDEAIILTHRLSATRLGDRPEVHALLALMLLHSSRLPARVGPDGALCLLEGQDRTLWDRERIAAGLARLSQAAAGDRMTPYHCEAAIAACHACAPTFEATDWRAVLAHYDDLVTLAPSAVARLNRAVALAMVEGYPTALETLDGLADDPKMRAYYLFPATQGRFLQRLGRLQEAREAYVSALELAVNDAEKRFLERRLTELRPEPVTRE